MHWDVNLFGLFVNGGMAAAVLAVGATLGLRRLLATAGAYAWVWHPALADLALFVLLWSGAAALAYYGAQPLSLLLG
ncbi:MAG: hypothetical protein JWQ76_3638 [Ramlibacter sp.]|nr:hypothetical protein [Ramlibacter sp.]